MSRLLRSFKKVPLFQVKSFQVRSIAVSPRCGNLFGGSSDLKNEAPQQQTASNPADLLKKNDVLMYSQKPINYIESIKHNGFHLANDILITSPNDNGEEIGTVLIESESFEVNLSHGGYKIVNGFQVDFSPKQVLSLFEKIHPKPEILVVGLGKKSRMLLDSNRRFFSDIGIQLEVGDSRNAARLYDVLATERPGVIAALLLPPNA